jgi:hypothetical protein
MRFRARRIRRSLGSRSRQLLEYPIGVLARTVEQRIGYSAALMDNASLSAKLYAYEPGSDSFILPDDAVAKSIAGTGPLPVPPPELWEGYGPTLDDYLNSGREHFDNMIAVLAEAGSPSRNDSASSISAARPDASSAVWWIRRTCARSGASTSARGTFSGVGII